MPRRVLSRQPDQSRQRQAPACRLDLPDRCQGIARDVADRRWRRDVRDHFVQPCLCAGRQDRQAALALRRTRWDRSRRSAAAPTTAASQVLDDKVYLATLDFKLVALNAKTGETVWMIDIADPELGYSETMAPTVIKDKVLIGTNGGEYGIRGFVRAYRCQDRQADLEFQHHSGQFRGRLGRPRTPPAATCIATSRPKRIRLAKNGDPFAKLGGGVWQNPSIDLGHQPDLFRGRQSVARPRRLDPARRQSLHGLAGLARPRHRKIRLSLPVYRP